MFQVETYVNLKQFFTKSFVPSSEELHIFDMESMVMESNKYHLLSMTLEDLNRSLFSEWYHPFTDVYLKNRIRDFCSSDSSIEAKRLLHSIREVLITYRFIEETDIPITLSYAKNSEEKLVINIIEKIKKDEYVLKYAPWKQLHFNQMVREKFSNIRTIYFYEMDFLSASTMKLIHALYSAGFTIKFRIPYDGRFPITYQGWRKIFEGISRNKADEWLPLQSSDHERGTKFANFIEGRNILVQDDVSPNIMRFANTEMFHSYFKQHQDYSWIAVDRETLNTITNTTVNRRFENMYGKFIYFLQRCTKKNDQIFLTYETFEELLTSAWVYDRNIQGIDATAILKDLSGYMEGITTMDDIIDRITHLQNLNEVSKIFDQEGEEKAGKNRVKRYLSNPFRLLPYVHQHRYQITIKQLYDLTIDLQKKLQYLLINDNEKMDINEYLERYAKSIVRISRNWDESEALKYQKAFQKQFTETFMCSQPELFDLLNICLTNIENDTDHFQGLLQIPSYLFDERESLHLTDLSLFEFPKGAPTLPKWLNYGRLKEVIPSDHPNRQILYHCLLIDYLSRNHAKDLSIYSLYSLLAFYEGNLEISWINHLRENDLPSIYLEFLTELYGEKELTPGVSLEDYIVEGYKGVGDKEILVEDLDSITGQFPNLYWLDHDFCSRKFFYSSIIEQQPIYETDFHQRIAFSTLGTLLEQQSGGRKDIEEILFPLFPQWTNALKVNLLNTEFPIRFKKYREFDNVRYPEAMKRLQRLRSIYQENRRTKARNQYNDNRLNEKELLKQFKDSINATHIQADIGHHCKMCPHLTICMEGMYAIDGNRN